MPKVFSKALKIIVIILLGLLNYVQAQSPNDLALLSTHTQTSDLPDHSYQKSNKKTKFIQAVNPVYWIYKGGISFYQAHISSQLSTSCIYETSCSRFGKKLFNEFGVFKGVFLSADRISRCNRLTYSQTSRLSLNTEGKVIEHIHDYSNKK